MKQLTALKKPAEKDEHEPAVYQVSDRKQKSGIIVLGKKNLQQKRRIYI